MQTPSPQKPAIAPAKRITSLRDLWPFLRPYRYQVALAFVLLCLASGTLLLVPLAFRDLIDFGFGAAKAAGDSNAGSMAGVARIGKLGFGHALARVFMRPKGPGKAGQPGFLDSPAQPAYTPPIHQALP